MPIDKDTVEKQKIEMDAAIFNPASVFKKPEEILEDQKITLSKEEKIIALKTWRYDIQLRRVAEEENMHSNQTGDDAALEDKIIAALKTLEGPEPGKTSKAKP